MATIPVGITTAPRPGPPVLERTVASLLGTGFDEITIFAEPDSQIADWVRQRAKVLSREMLFGEWRNWLHGLKYVLQDTDADAVMMVEDDVVFCRNVAALLERETWPSEQCGAIHVYTSRRYRNLPRGLSQLPPAQVAMRLSAACAVLFRREAAEAVVQYGQTEGWKGEIEPQDDPVNVQETDSFIGVALNTTGYELWCHNPSLALHVGHESHSGHGGPHGARRELDFPGEKADASELCR